MSEIEHVVIPELLADDSDSIFQMPEDISSDARLSGIYREIVRRLRDEVSGIPMTTMQYLLIERTASLYVTIKHREENGTFLPREQQQYTAQFLAASAEFNKLVQNNQEQQRMATVERVQTALVAAINRMPNPEDRKMIRDLVTDEFRKAGL